MELAPHPRAARGQGDGQAAHPRVAFDNGPEAGGGPEPPRLPETAVAKPAAQPAKLPCCVLAALSAEPFEMVFADPLAQPPSLSRTPSPDHLQRARGAGGACQERRCPLRDLDSGRVRDLVDPKAASLSFVGRPSQFPRPAPKPWRRWWCDKRRRDERLCLAAEAGDLAALRELLAPPADGGAPASPNAVGPCGRPALHLAAAAGRAEAVCALLEAGAAAGARAAGGLTALHAASRRGDPQGAEALLAAGAAAAAEAEDGSLPLHLAAAGGHPEVAALLLERGGAAQLRARDRLGRRPAEAAADVRTARLLGLAGAAAASGGGAPAGEDRYARRTAFCGGAVLLRNARADDVRRLLRRARGSPPPAAGPGGRGSGPAAALPESPGSSPSTPRVHAPFVRVRSSSPGAERAGPHSFELLDLLGRGAFGEVFHVRHKETQQPYAMKVLRKFRIRSSNLLRYTLTERNILAYVRHPYIVSLHYAFQTPSHLVLVLQFCPQGNLQQLISREKRLPEGLSRLYTAEILLALCHIHARQTIFRDLKPDNVVIDDERHALLTDFGLSKEGVKGLQGAKSFCGSLAFLAPEILLRRPHGHTVDIYNLGVLLYHMLTGQPPFFHPDPDRLFANIKRASLEVPEYVPEAAGDLIRATMAREPSRRLGALQTAELKGHAFFAGLDFDAALRRELRPPEPGPPRARPQRSPRPAPPRSPFATPDWAAGGPGAARRARAGGIEEGQVVPDWEFASVR